MNEQEFIDKQFLALGTVNNIKIYQPVDEKVIQKAIDRIYEIEDRMSAFRPNSDISTINENAGKGKTKVHKDTFEVLKAAAHYAKSSKGAYDLTIRPLVELWGIGKKDSYIPSNEEINSVIRLVSYKDILLKEKIGTVELKKVGQKIDLGGIAKGYAADEVKRILLENSIKNAMINLGGNILTMGCRKENEPWVIGIQNPLAPTGSYLGTIRLQEKTIVTSGSNERFFMKDGKRYHHILDPITGAPAESHLLSVTVVCDSSMEADALTTAMFVMGLEKGLKFLKRFHADAIFITSNMGIYLTNGLKENFTIA